LFPHLVDASRHLGCSRVHLYRVLLDLAPDHHGLKAGYVAFAAKQRKVGVN
jgi:hypothetical protein